MTSSRPRITPALSLIAALVTVTAAAAAPVSLGTAGATYTQDFTTLSKTVASTALPTGWAIAETGTSANSSYTPDAGALATGDTYSYGNGAQRALGSLQSTTLTPMFGVGFSNDTGVTLTSLQIAFTGEQWRLGALGRLDKLDFQYSTDATSLTTGNYLDFDGLDFVAPKTGPSVGALNGQAAGNRVGLSALLAGLNIASGSTFWLRWTDFNASGADDGLAVDDFALTANGPATDGAATNRVPEPGTLALVGIALLGLARARRGRP